MALRDTLLDGTFYDNLPHEFYDEQQNGEDIPLDRRKPSSQYHLPRMVADWTARKLWAGRHVPRVRHQSQDMTNSISQLIKSSKLFYRMKEATILGSVGSVGMTFRVDLVEGSDPQVAVRVWRAKNCTPTLDDADNLINLRLHYIVKGIDLLTMDLGEPMPLPPLQEEVRPQENYWFVRDFMQDAEVTYGPVCEADWNPVQGFTKPDIGFRVWRVVPHGLGFVPAVWIRNLPNDCGIDGASTWGMAVDMSIELDYMISQMARGTRYNCAPQLIVIGQFAEEPGDEGVVRSPSHVLHLKGGMKGSDGYTVNAGEAKLLEMNGKGMEAADKLCDRLRNMALEQIGAVRKDPEKLHGVLSGRAMEFLDEDAHDLIMELRESYGDALLEIVRKIMRAVGMGGSAQGLRLVWPRIYQPTPDDLAALIPALVLAATPIVDETAGPKAPGPKNALGEAGRPAQPMGKSIGALLEVEEAATFLRVNMDLDVVLGDEEAPPDDDRPVNEPPPPRRRDDDAYTGDSGSAPAGHTPPLESQLVDI